MRCDGYAPNEYGVRGDLPSIRNFPNDSGMTSHIPCLAHDTFVSNGIPSGHEKAVQEVLLPVVKVEKEKVEKVEKAWWGRHGQFPLSILISQSL